MTPAGLTAITRETTILNSIIRNCNPARLYEHFHSERRDAEVCGTTVSLVAARGAIFVQNVGCRAHERERTRSRPTWRRPAAARARAFHYPSTGSLRC